jgi:hypothetical protein
MSGIKRNPRVAGIALRLDRLRKAHLFTSYPLNPAASTADAKIELPLPTGPDAVWLSDSTVIGCAVDAASWPAWTDEVRFAAGEGVAR